MREGRNQYAPMAGWPPLLRCHCGQGARRSTGGRVSAADEVTVTSGGTEALFCAVQAVVRAGRRSHPARARLRLVRARGRACGRAGRACAAASPGFRRGLGPRPGGVHGAHAAHHRQLAAQPERARFSRSRTSTRSADLLRASGALVLSDEVYEHMLFDGRSHASMLTRAELAARSFVVSSFGKTFHATGLEDRLLRRAPGVDGRVPQGAPVRAVRRRDADAGGPCRSFSRSPRSTASNCPPSTRPSATTSAGCSPTRRSPSRRPPAPISSSPTTRPSATCPTSSSRAGSRAKSAWRPFRSRYFPSMHQPARLVRFCFAKHETTLDAAGERLR